MSDRNASPLLRRPFLKPLCLRKSATFVAAFLAFTLGCSPVTGGPQPAAPRLAPPAPRVTTSVAAPADVQALPIPFIQNQGQWDERVVFQLAAGELLASFEPSRIRYALRSAPLVDLAGQPEQQSRAAADSSTGEAGPPRPSQLDLELVGARPGVVPVGRARSETAFNFFVGLPQRWRSDVPGFREIAYEDVWPEIDLVYSQDAQRQLKYAFVVRPGGDPGQIRLLYRGISAARLDEAGQVVLESPGGTIVDQRPVSYQDLGASRSAVPSQFGLELAAPDGALVDLRVGAYDPTKTLVIDPVVLAWGTYLGGSRADGYQLPPVAGSRIAVDGLGNALVTGGTISADFPTPNGMDQAFSPAGVLRQSPKVFVAKLTPDGALAWGTFLGGSRWDMSADIAVDSAGNAYVTGWTGSADFPGTSTAINGLTDAFVVKLTSAGALAWGTYLGGSEGEEGVGIGLDGSDNIYVTGTTWSADFPTPNGARTSLSGKKDAYVARLSPDGTLVWGTYLGGGQDEEGLGIAVDPSGNGYVTGWTSSGDFPTPNGTYTKLNDGSTVARPGDAFVVKLTEAGALVWGTFLGGRGGERGQDIALDASGNVYVTGSTSSSDFPTLNGMNSEFRVASRPPGTVDAQTVHGFATKLATDGVLAWSTFIGGGGDDGGAGLAVDSGGNVYITGWTTSADFPTPEGADSTFHGRGDAFVLKLSSAGTLVWGTFLGGGNIDAGVGIGVDSAANVYVTGYTESSDFPSPGGADTTLDGKSDIFVVKLTQ